MFRTDVLSKQTDNNIQTNNERNGVTYVQSFASMNQVVEGLLSGFWLSRQLLNTIVNFCLKDQTNRSNDCSKTMQFLGTFTGPLVVFGQYVGHTNTGQ